MGGKQFKYEIQSESAAAAWYTYKMRAQPALGLHFATHKFPPRTLIVN